MKELSDKKNDFSDEQGKFYMKEKPLNFHNNSGGKISIT